MPAEAVVVVKVLLYKLKTFENVSCQSPGALAIFLTTLFMNNASLFGHCIYRFFGFFWWI